MCRFFGLTIVAVLLVLFTVSMFDRNMRFDRPVVLAFLGIGSALAGVPNAYHIVLGKGSSSEP